ncbi:MAG: hypothetical protein ABIS47_12570 [Acidimicrobiales bacterium]
MQKATPDQAIQAQTLVTARWVARAETRGLRIGTWVLILGSLALPQPAGSIVGGVNLVVILGQLLWSSRVAARARRELSQADPARLRNIVEQLRTLPGPRRTFEALHAAMAGVGVAAAGGVPLPAGRAPAPPAAATADDGLSCYDRGGHVPGCPHRPLDGSGIV